MSKLILLLMLLAVLSSLGFALYYLVHDRGSTPRMVRALTWRTLLSIALFVLLLLAGAADLLGPRATLSSPPFGSLPASATHHSQ